MRRFRGRHGPGEGLRQAPPPTVPRLARNYQTLIRNPIDRSTYPAVDVDSVAPSIHDVPLVQDLFTNDANFSSSTSCDVFEMGFGDGENAIGSWSTITGDTGMEHFVQVSVLLIRLLALLRHTACRLACDKTLNPINSQCINLVNQTRDFAPCKCRGVTDASKPPNLARQLLLLIQSGSFCSLKHFNNTSFGVQISIMKKDMLRLLASLRVCPQFCKPMLGEPDYWAPLAIYSLKEDGSIRRAGELSGAHITEIRKRVNKKSYFHRVHLPASAIHHPYSSRALFRVFGL